MSRYRQPVLTDAQIRATCNALYEKIERGKLTLRDRKLLVRAINALSWAYGEPRARYRSKR